MRGTEAKSEFIEGVGEHRRRGVRAGGRRQIVDLAEHVEVAIGQARQL